MIARLDHPEIHAEARIVGASDIAAGAGDPVKLEVLRTVTDRKAGVARFDCRLVE